MKNLLGTLSVFVVLVAVLLVPGAPARAEEEGGPPAVEPPRAARILFLHHSTGECIWNGGVPAWFEAYNAAQGTNHRISERSFPKDAPYGWENYPYDYYTIWVANAGPEPYREEPTLEILTPEYDLIVFKHCYPVSQIEEVVGEGDVASSDKRIENYRLQYAALKEKLRAFPDTRFLLWTGAALVRHETDEAAARRARSFFEWVKGTWDEPGDNVFLWDFHELETEGGLYLKDEYAQGDSHPSEAFSRRVAPLFCQRIVDVLAGQGDETSLTGRPAASE